ncbi:hypothetical protein DH86_00001720 [Scytalidium sp. 3C]|nr:hypothetical protein DH86_00001720 [Scytalidium sp. 3C]
MTSFSDNAVINIISTLPRTPYRDQNNLNREFDQDVETGSIVFDLGLFASDANASRWKRSRTPSPVGRLPSPPATDGEEWEEEEGKGEREGEEDEWEEEKGEQEEDAIADHDWDYRYPIPSPARSGWVVDDLSGRERKRLLMDDLPPAKRRCWIQRRLDLRHQQGDEIDEDEVTSGLREQCEQNFTEETGETEEERPRIIQWAEAAWAAQPDDQKGARFREAARAHERSMGRFLRGIWEGGDSEEDEEDEDALSTIEWDYESWRLGID